MTKTLNFNEFFIEFGKLLYAVANADGSIQKEEEVEINTLIKNEFIKISSDTDEFGTNSAFYTGFSFETMVDRKVDVAIAYQSFLLFLSNNKNLINRSLCELCIRSVKDIASKVNGIDENEQKLINELSYEIDKIFA